MENLVKEKIILYATDPIHDELFTVVALGNKSLCFKLYDNLLVSYLKKIFVYVVPFNINFLPIQSIVPD